MARSTNRSLNAFAIAQSQVTEKSPVPKHRLGQALPKSKKHARRDGGDGKGGDGDNELKSRRARRGDEDFVDGGSDSDGGQWKVGVNSDDESDIDSDEAMGGSDEERFADFTFRGSSSTGKVKEGGGIAEVVDLGESEEGDGEWEEGVEGFIDLSEMLERAETPNGGDKMFTEKQKPRFKKRVAPESGSESASEDEDNLISSVDNKPSDDNDSDTDSLTHLSDGEEVPEDPTKLSALQSLISSLPSTSTQPTAKRIRLDDPNEGKSPSEYNLSLGPTSQKLTVDDLMPSITDPKLKKALKVLSDTTPAGTKSSGVQRKLSAPLTKRQQERMDRAAAYAKTNETLGRWVDTVKANREADHLHFPLANAPNAPIKAPNRLSVITPSNSTPFTTLEATISGILQDSNMASEKQIKEFEELKTNKLSIEEVQKRTAELRIARELLYREEVKAKRIKRIKSKAYHRIHKKERMRQEQAIKDALAPEKGSSLGEEEIMEQERKRAEERMTLRHSQSKWAKGTKESGRSIWDEEAKNGANEMARRAEELKRRIQGKGIHGNESSFESSSSSESDDEFDEEGVEIRKKLLKDIERSEVSLGVVSGGAGKKLGGRLMEMRFMQSAEAAMKKKNDAALQELKNSLEDGGKMSGDEESDEEPKQSNSRMTFKPGKKDNGLAAPKTNISELGEADMSGREEEQGDEGDGEVIFVNKASTASTVLKNLISAPKTTTGKAGGKHISFGAIKDDNPTSLTNPWLTQDQNVKPKQLSITGKPESRAEHAIKKLTKNKKAALKSRKPSENEEVEIDTSVTLKLTPKKLSNPDDGDEVDDKEINLIPTKGGKGDNQNQRKLVKRAFGGDNVVLDFSKEKKHIVEDEGNQVIDESLPGWGSWTGGGLGPRRYKGAPKRQFLKTVQGIAQDKRKDARLAKVIINEKRVKKNVKYNASNLPHPFETKQQYERSLRVPIGPEWATKVTFQDSTMPRVIVKKGVVVEAISAPFKSSC